MMSIVRDNNVTVMTNTSLLEVNDDSFKVERDGKEENIKFDYGFVCLGMKNNSPILSQLHEHFGDSEVEVINIGDSYRARRIIDGVQEGRNITDTLESIGAFSELAINI